MRILVVSDTHRNFRALCTAIEQQPKAEMVLFLGDKLDEFEDAELLYPHKKFLAVCGNNDFYSTVPAVRFLNPGGVPMVMTHGHLQGVHGKTGGIEQLEKLATEFGAKVVLYGHTHCSNITYHNGVYYVNPGSPSCPRDGCASFAYIDISPAGIMPVRVKITGEVLPY